MSGEAGKTDGREQPAVSLSAATSAAPDRALPFTRDRSDAAAWWLALSALVLSCWGLLQWDVPVTRFVRTLYHPIGYLLNPWLAQLSNSGDYLGKGDSLVFLSLVLLAGGLGFGLVSWKAAGWQTLFAHGIAALVSTALKHLIGRPRPKFMHAGHAWLTPAGGSGWDSFPSGHTTASFAVAAVLATRFPKFRWIFLILSLGIAASRIVRGSHYLTDAAGGAALGYIIGTIVAHPWRDWRSSATDALFAASPCLAGLLALVWVIGHRSTDLWPAPILVAGGLFLTTGGLILHVFITANPGAAPAWLSKTVTQAAIGAGFGMATGSLWAAATVWCACLAYWLRKPHEGLDPVVVRNRSGLVLAKEAAFSLLVLLGLLATVKLRGIIPMM